MALRAALDPEGARRRLAEAPIGTRMVVRYRLADGYSDVLGTLEQRDDASVTIRTRRALVRVLLVEVVAAKQVPDPPPPRSAKQRG